MNATNRERHIPTAAPAPVRLTRAQVREQLAATDDGDWDRGPAIPKFPGQRRSNDKPLTPAPRTPSDLGFGFGEHAALAAFGAA